jgi:hypothetical protein
MSRRAGREDLPGPFDCRYHTAHFSCLSAVDVRHENMTRKSLKSLLRFDAL